uniref:UBX domain-containing protein 4 n=1 Tax=Heliothis virescens TaxID=7102 RepID=A0A2A4J1P3_HELVI
MPPSASRRILCLNCNACINTFRRYLVNELSTRVVSLLSEWVSPVIITQEDYICEPCNELLMRSINQQLPTSGDGAPTSGSSRPGRRQVCSICGRSTVNRQSHAIVIDSPSEQLKQINSVIQTRIAPRQISSSDRICHACWTSCKRAATRIEHADDGRGVATTEEVQVDTDNSEIMTAEPVHESLDQPSVVTPNEITLENYRRAANTASHCLFPQYQFVPVPSLFFIGRNGTPLEVVCAGVQPSNLATRIDRILEEHFKDKQVSPSPVQPSTSSSDILEAAGLHEQESASVQDIAPPPGFPPLAEQRPPPGFPLMTEQTPPGFPPMREQAPPPGFPPMRDSPNVREQTVSFVQTESAALSRQVEKPKEPDSVSSSPRAKIQKIDPEARPLTPEYDIVCDGDVCVRRPRTKPDEPGPSQAPTPSLPHAPADDKVELPSTESGGSIEEKMERAKELIEARRREKADKEKELEKEKEMERRAAGKGVAELKRWQADQELKQIQEERRREKMENNLARQRILEQIAQDRLERRARDVPPAQPQPSVQATPTAGDGGTRARIQFKLPDGTSHTAHFDADGTLAEVQRYVADNLQLSTSSFALWTAFPRRELTEAESSLRGLQLAPSAALLVLPRRMSPVVARPSPVASLITFFTQLFTTMILEPSQQLLIWLRTRLFPPPAPRVTSPQSGAPGPAPGPPAPGARRRGNIHRLPSDRAADDDNNTWNGNSTQQM